jgi:hypothetical protein
MLPPGTIPRLTDFAFDFLNDKEKRHAFRDFFENGDLADVNDPEVKELFLEWLIFDRKIKGRSVLEAYIERNPDTLDTQAMKTYTDLTKSQYGVFTIEEIRVFVGFTLRDIFTDMTYQIREQSGTLQAETDTTVLVRIGPVGDGWEIISPSMTALPITFGR